MEQSAWLDVVTAVTIAPYPVEVLPVDAERAAACVRALSITTRSWLGAVAAGTGGLTVHHGWLRVLGGGHGSLPSVAEQLAAGGRLIVAYDVMGGQFGWWSGETSDVPTVHYFGPDSLAWVDLEVGYGHWLHAMLTGALTEFYENLRWPGWEAEVAALGLDQGIGAWPPPWSTQGHELAGVSRRPVPLSELVAFYEDSARQLAPDGA